MPPLLIERTGFTPWISIFRYCLDTILECGSLLPLFYRRAFKSGGKTKRAPTGSGPNSYSFKCSARFALLLFFGWFFRRRGGRPTPVFPLVTAHPFLQTPTPLPQPAPQPPHFPHPHNNHTT